MHDDQDKITTTIQQIAKELSNTKDQRAQLRLKIVILKTQKSKKWMPWANSQQGVEAWNIKVDLADDSEVNEASVRERMRAFMGDVAKESLRNFEHMAEGVGDDFDLIFELVKTH